MTMRRLWIAIIKRLMLYHARTMNEYAAAGQEELAVYHRRQFCRLALRLYELEVGS